MATYVNDLRLKEISTGDEAGTWGTSTNTNLELIAEAFSFGTEAITTNADTHTTTIADGSTDPGRSLFLKYTGTLDSTCTITVGPNTVSKLWFIENATSGSQSIIIKQGSGATITIANGQTKAIYSDGAGSGAAMVDAFTDLSVPSFFVSGDLDVDGTTNLDVVDIDGAVDFASTTAHAGNATFADNAKAIFGAGSDLQIYHDGSHSYVSDQGTGNLNIQTNGVGVVIEHTDGTNLAVFNAGDGTASLYHSGNLKLSTASTGIDVTGDVDASANYKVNGTLLIDSSMNLQNLNLVQVATGSSTAPSIRFTGDTNTGFARPAADTLGFITGGSERMRIDSSGNVGIGTGVAPGINGSGLSIFDALYPRLTFRNNTTGDSSAATVGTSAYLVGDNFYLNNQEAGILSFGTNATERMRIDSVGRVFIGNANNDTNPASTGSASNKGATFGGTSDPYLSIGRVGEAAAVLGRIDSAGDIILFYGDGSTVGSIGTGSGLLTIGTGTGNLVFENALVAPCSDSSVGSSNGVVDLGQSARRFKDLYLSGGAYLGGTGAANKLDDYEEGTWTGSATAGASSTLSVADEKYTKIGNQVTIQCTINFSGASGSLEVAGLPFASAPAAVGIGREDATSGYAVYGRVTSGNTSFSVFYAGGLLNATPFQVSAGNFRYSMTYLT